ncbi:hypothetical protein [Actinacidiphila glaucinigra]|uniref:hypothetical protein n=1 Tax=Actinacidiphila glaucinigra TaxID=235986 RepID=UPI0036721D20
MLAVPALGGLGIRGVPGVRAVRDVVAIRHGGPIRRRLLVVGVVQRVHEGHAVQLRQPVGRVRGAALVGLQRLGEPLARVVLTTRREQSVGVRVAQPRRPRVHGVGRELGALQGDDGGVVLPHVTPGTGGHQAHLHLTRAVQLVHLRRTRHLQRALRTAHAPLAVRHDRPQVDRARHPAAGAELGQRLGIPLRGVRGEPGRLTHGGDTGRESQRDPGVAVRQVRVLVQQPGDHHEVPRDVLGERLRQAHELLTHAGVDLLARDVVRDRQPLDGLPLLTALVAAAGVLEPPTPLHVRPAAALAPIVLTARAAGTLVPAVVAAVAATVVVPPRPTGRAVTAVVARTVVTGAVVARPVVTAEATAVVTGAVLARAVVARAIVTAEPTTVVTPIIARTILTGTVEARPIVAGTVRTRPVIAAEPTTVVTPVVTGTVLAGAVVARAIVTAEPTTVVTPIVTGTILTRTVEARAIVARTVGTRPVVTAEPTAIVTPIIARTVEAGAVLTGTVGTRPVIAAEPTTIVTGTILTGTVEARAIVTAEPTTIVTPIIARTILTGTVRTRPVIATVTAAVITPVVATPVLVPPPRTVVGPAVTAAGSVAFAPGAAAAVFTPVAALARSAPLRPIRPFLGRVGHRRDSCRSYCCSASLSYRPRVAHHAKNKKTLGPSALARTEGP